MTDNCGVSWTFIHISVFITLQVYQHCIGMGIYNANNNKGKQMSENNFMSFTDKTYFDLIQCKKNVEI